MHRAFERLCNSARVLWLPVLVSVGSCDSATTGPVEVWESESNARALSFQVETLRFAEGSPLGGIRLSATSTVTGDSIGQTRIDNLHYGSLTDMEARELLESQVTRPYGERSPLALQGPTAMPSGLDRSVRGTDEDGGRLRLLTKVVQSGRYAVPVAYVLLRNDSVRAIIEVQRAGGSDESSMRIRHVDERGGIYGLSVINGQSAPPHLGTIGASVDRARAGVWSVLAESCGKLLGLLAPAPLLAQEEECVDYEVDLMFAAAAFVSAEAVVIATCLPWAPVLPAPCIAAIGGLSLASAYLTWATSQYEACLASYWEPPPSGDGPEMRAADVQDIDDDCFYIDWEISYDGGQTWHFYGRQIIC